MEDFYRSLLSTDPNASPVAHYISNTSGTQKCGNPNAELAEGENACDTSCIPFIGCFNCD